MDLLLGGLPISLLHSKPLHFFYDKLCDEHFVRELVFLLLHWGFSLALRGSLPSIHILQWCESQLSTPALDFLTSTISGLCVYSGDSP